MSRLHMPPDTFVEEEEVGLEGEGEGGQGSEERRGSHEVRNTSWCAHGERSNCRPRAAPRRLPRGGFLPPCASRVLS